MTYAEKLKDPRWQKVRLQILGEANFSCEWCDDKETTLHVHHFYYKKGANPWDYPRDALICLCENCHRFNHLKIIPDPIQDTVCTLSCNPKKNGEAIRTLISYCLDYYK